MGFVVPNTLDGTTLSWNNIVYNNIIHNEFIVKRKTKTRWLSIERLKVIYREKQSSKHRTAMYSWRFVPIERPSFTIASTILSFKVYTHYLLLIIRFFLFIRLKHLDLISSIFTNLVVFSIRLIEAMNYTNNCISNRNLRWIDRWICVNGMWL